MFSSTFANRFHPPVQSRVPPGARRGPSLPADHLRPAANIVNHAAGVAQVIGIAPYFPTMRGSRNDQCRFIRGGNSHH
jgi:hypothetical protein